MDFSNIRLLSLMKVKMAWHAENQDVLSHNVANADTPGFKPQKLKDLDFKRLALVESRRLEMRATSLMHQEGIRRAQHFRVEKQKPTYETTPVENGVALEEQMAAAAYNQHEYALTTSLYRKTAGMFRMAIGNN